MKKFLLCFVLTVGTIIGITSCSDNDGDKFPAENHHRTLFIYMGGDDASLSNYVNNNMTKILKGATSSNMRYGRIVVFQDRRNDVPRLLLIEPGKNGGVEKEIETYPDDPSTEQPEVLKAAIKRMQEIAPANSYGMVLWSHGTGWLPDRIISPYSAKGTAGEGLTEWMDESGGINKQYVYMDNGKIMNLDVFAEALPAGIFDFIILDECYSGGIEVAWALKDKVNYLVMSAAEVDVIGMPYDDIMPHMFAAVPVLGEGGVCEEYYNYYNSETTKPGEENRSRSATTALINCSALDDEFRSIVSNILQQNADKIGKLSRNSVQYYDRLSPHLFYDLTEFIKAITSEDDPLRIQFIAKMDKVVEYENALPNIFNSYFIDVEKHCGLTTYIPFDDFSKLNKRYTETAWYKAVFPAGFIQ